MGKHRTGPLARRAAEMKDMGATEPQETQEQQEPQGTPEPGMAQETAPPDDVASLVARIGAGVRTADAGLAGTAARLEAAKADHAQWVEAARAARSKLTELLGAAGLPVTQPRRPTVSASKRQAVLDAIKAAPGQTRTMLASTLGGMPIPTVSAALAMLVASGDVVSTGVRDKRWYAKEAP